MRSRQVNNKLPKGGRLEMDEWTKAKQYTAQGELQGTKAYSLVLPLIILPVDHSSFLFNMGLSSATHTPSANCLIIGSPVCGDRWLKVCIAELRRQIFGKKVGQVSRTSKAISPYCMYVPQSNQTKWWSMLYSYTIMDHNTSVDQWTA